MGRNSHKYTQRKQAQSCYDRKYIFMVMIEKDQIQKEYNRKGSN
jgi:hypothetical protein